MENLKTARSCKIRGRATGHPMLFFWKIWRSSFRRLGTWLCRKMGCAPWLDEPPRVSVLYSWIQSFSGVKIGNRFKHLSLHLGPCKKAKPPDVPQQLDLAHCSWFCTTFQHQRTQRIPCASASRGPRRGVRPSEI